jgi:hypothetical protein
MAGGPRAVRIKLIPSLSVLSALRLFPKSKLKLNRLKTLQQKGTGGTPYNVHSGEIPLRRSRRRRTLHNRMNLYSTYAVASFSFSSYWWHSAAQVGTA